VIPIGVIKCPILNYGNVLVVIFFHRRGAKCAEDIYFMFAVERPRIGGMTVLLSISAGRPPANIKGNPPQTLEINFTRRSEIALDIIARRAWVFNFLEANL
jgi:hypothetical protein